VRNLQKSSEILFMQILLLGFAMAQNACLLSNRAMQPSQIPQQLPPQMPKPVLPKQPVTTTQTGRLTYYTFGPQGIAFCDGKYYGDNELIVALSTSFMNERKNCFQKVRVTVEGKSVVATVVDMCNEQHGCKVGTVDGTIGIWKTLGLDLDRGVIEGITWSFL
jgi:hypothetical protein